MKKINKIFIDPGHVGKNFFDFRNFEIDGIEFHEGDFCYAWAEILQKKLIKKYGIVQLSRISRRPSILVNDMDKNRRIEELVKSIGIDEALKKFRVPINFFPNKNQWELLEASVQNEADLIHRSEMAFKGSFDVCLSLHLNGDPKKLQTDMNGICGFTNFSSSEFFTLFEDIIQNISLNTELPIMENNNLKEVGLGLYVDESLTLLRSIKIPVLLIEGPFQNNPIELKLLNSSLIDYCQRNTVSGRMQQLTDSILSIL